MKNILWTLTALIVVLAWPALGAQAPGPFGDSIHAMIYQDLSVFALGEGGVYRSTDGETWQRLLPGPALAGTLDARGRLIVAQRRGGVWRLDEDGRWSPLGSEGTVLDLAVLGDDLYAATADGLLRYDGDRWSAAGLEGRPVSSLTGLEGPIFDADGALLAVEGVLFAGSGGDLFRSLDGGAWKPAAVFGGRISALTVDTATGLVYAGTSGGAFHLSRDHGASWEERPSPVAGGVSAIAVEARELHLAGLGEGVFLSYDDGASWTAVSRRLDRRVQALMPAGGSLLAGTRTGIFYLDDSFAWTLSNRGLPPAQVSRLLVDDDDQVHAVSPRFGIFSRQRNGHWESYSQGLPTGAHDLALGGDERPSFAATARGLYRRAPRDESWESLRVPAELYPLRLVAVDPGLPGVVYAASATRLWRSDDDGETWAEVLGRHRFTALAAGQGRVFAVTRGAGLLTSFDGGFTWSSTMAELQVRQVVRGELGGETVVVAVAAGQGAYVSRDGGTTWKRFSAPERPVASVALAGGALCLGFTSGDIDCGEGTDLRLLGRSPGSATSIAIAGGRVFVALADGGVLELEMLL